MSSWSTIAAEIVIAVLAGAVFMPSKYASNPFVWFACMAVLAIDVILLIASFVALAGGVFNKGDQNN